MSGPRKDKQATCPRCGMQTYGQRGQFRGCNDCWLVDPDYMRLYTSRRQDSRKGLAKAS